MKMIVVMNIRRMFLGMAVLCGFSVSAAAEGHFDKLSDRVKEVPEPVVEVTVVRQEGSGKGKLIDDVNVFVGTDGFGNVYPGPQVPFGGIQISPDCDDKDYDCAAGYKYSKPFIQGFSLTHLSGTGIPDMGDFLFLPGTGSKMEPSTYDHTREWGEPGYYGVILKDYGVKAEMTAARRSGIFKFTFPQSDSSFVMIDLDHTLKWDCLWSTVRLLDERTIIGSKVVNGWNPGRYVYFVARFSRPIEEFNIFQDGQPVIYNTKRFRSSLEAWGQKLKAVARFKTGADESIFIDVAVSAVGTDGALNNLKELEGKDFAAVRTEAEDLWEKELGKYELDSDDKTLRETFYTSVYRPPSVPIRGCGRTLPRARWHDRECGRLHQRHDILAMGHLQGFPPASQPRQQAASGRHRQLDARPFRQKYREDAPDLVVLRRRDLVHDRLSCLLCTGRHDAQRRAWIRLRARVPSDEDHRHQPSLRLHS